MDVCALFCFPLWNFYLSILSHFLFVFWWVFFVFSVKEGRSLLFYGFHRPSAGIDVPGRILLSYQNVSILHPAAIVANSFTATKDIPSCPLKLV